MSEENKDANTSVESGEGSTSDNSGRGSSGASSAEMVPSQKEIKQQVDVDAIVKKIKGGLDVSSQVKSEIKNTLREMFTGEPEKKEANKIHKYFAEKPEDFVADLEDMVLEKVEARERYKKEQTKKLAPIVNEFTQKYPALKNFKPSIEAEAKDIMLSGKSEVDALREALENHAKSLEAVGIKARSEEDRRRDDSMFPPTNSGGAYAAHTKAVSSGDATADYVKQQREARQRFRKKVA